MSAIREEQLPTASKFMTLFWKEIVKPYYNPEQSEAWWDDFIQKMSQIGDAYCLEDRRLMRILIGFCDGLQEVYRDERDK